VLVCESSTIDAIARGSRTSPRLRVFSCSRHTQQQQGRRPWRGSRGNRAAVAGGSAPVLRGPAPSRPGPRTAGHHRRRRVGRSQRDHAQGRWQAQALDQRGYNQQPAQALWAPATCRAGAKQSGEGTRPCPAPKSAHLNFNLGRGLLVLSSEPLFSSISTAFWLHISPDFFAKFKSRQSFQARASSFVLRTSQGLTHENHFYWLAK